MINKKNLIFVIVLVLFFGINVHAYTINTFNIVESITNAENIDTAYTVSGTLTDITGITDSLIPLRISSSEASNFDFNADVSGTNFAGNFYIDLNALTPAYHSTYPKRPIMVSAGIDTITVTDNNGQSKSDTLIVENIKPNIGTITITALGTNNGTFYRGDVNLSASGYTDADSYISKYIAYIVTSSNIASYSSAYTKKVQTDSNASSINLAIGTGLADGNYYVVLDARDAAGNVGATQSVIDTNKVLNIDNTKPSVYSFNLGTLTDKNIYYVDSNTFVINVVISESGSGIDDSPVATKMVITLPDSTTVTKDYNLTNLGFYHSQTGTWSDANVYQVALDVNDLVDNNLSIDFNIRIDSIGPTTPTKPSLTRTVDDNVTISTWGTATDSGSGLYGYNVYRSTSSFTSYTSETLICTVLASATKSCIDSTEKLMDTRYYYGVVAVDKAGNLSAVDANSISTGPSLSFDIDDDNAYTNDSTPKFTITTSSDVNALRFSCNASSFTSWIEISDNSDFEYTQFNITSGYGCTTTNGTKRIYIEARSEDSPYTITRKSETIKYDSIAPSVPSTIVATSLTNGSIKLTWSPSTDNNSGVNYYKIYYSDRSGVTTSSSYLTTEYEQYTFSPNADKNYYFKLSAVDYVNNESTLSTEIIGTAERIGPSFTISVSPVNVDNNINYVKAGTILIDAISDEDLVGTGIIKIKIGTGSYVTILAITTAEKITGDYNVTTSGTGIIEITGRNSNNESATDSFNFVADANVPVVDVNSSDVNGIYTIIPIELSSDVFRVQYLIDDTDELCLIDSNSVDFSCDFNSFGYIDGNHVISVLAYDKALNIGRAEITIEFDNVNEVMVERAELLSAINTNLDNINFKLEIYEGLLIPINSDVNTKLNSVYEKITSAKAMVGTNEIYANELYNQANNLLLEIIDILPSQSTIKLKNLVNKYTPELTNELYLLTSDTNLITDTNILYGQGVITVDRNFLVLEINSQKYYSVALEFKNSSANPITITFIEEIPKELATTVKDLIFTDQIEVLVDDPKIMHTLIIPAKGSITLKYNKKNPVTEFDVITKFDQISFKSPVILSGVVSSENLTVDSSLIKNKLLMYVTIFVLVIIVLLILVWILISANKRKQQGIAKPTAKEEIYNSLGKKNLGDDIAFVNKDVNKGMGDPIESKVGSDDTFQSNYDFILDAVKRSNRD